MPYTLTNLKADLEDVGSRFDGAPDLEFRLATEALELDQSGLSYQRVPPGYRLSEPGPLSSLGGEWSWSVLAPVRWIVPRTPGLIWVHGLVAGDVMVDRSVRRERLRPLGLRWSAALGRESQ